MSRNYSGNTVVWVDVEGYEVKVGVYLEYAVTVEGHREECEITDRYIHEPRTLPLTRAQVQQVFELAEQKFLNQRGHP